MIFFGWHRRLVGAFALVALLTTGSFSPALAGKAEVFTGLVEGVAVGGYDPVAYFTEGAPRKGDPAITTEYKGATWRFSSEANRALFAADPDKYAPQYGGYCAYALAQGALAKGEPEVWKIEDGKLYLNYSDLVQGEWLADMDAYIEAGDANWPAALQ